MKTTKLIAAAAMTTAGLAAGIGAIAASDTGSARRAAAEAGRANKALAKARGAAAVAPAEAAVALAPREAAYRALLGQAYLAAGRFTSAAAALGDAVALDPGNGRTALNLALAQIATGDAGAARETLARHGDAMPVADRGLALALAGAPGAAVAMLTEAARAADAGPKLRQNLALALGLAGRWEDARTVAAVDVAADEIDARILQWIAFARPSGASDQVASLLGVTAVADAGQPERLALATSAPVYAAIAQIAPVAVTRVAPQPAAAPAAVAPVAEAPRAPGVTFAARREIVQPLPGVRDAAPVRMAGSRDAAPRRVAAAAPQRARGDGGGYFVQLGSFRDTDGAAAWSRVTRRHARLAGYVPHGTAFSLNGANYYRLSVGGFARGEASDLCRRVRAGGGVCFVRGGAGDAVASFARRDVQTAARRAANRAG